MSDLVTIYKRGDTKSEWRIYPKGRVEHTDIHFARRVKVKCSYIYTYGGFWELDTIHTNSAIEFPYWPIRLFRRIFKRNTLPKATVVK